MVSVNVTQFRQNLPSYLARVQRGQKIQVTSRGKVIAEVGPPEADPDEISRARALLRGSLLEDHSDPDKPVIDPRAWEVSR